MKESVSIQSADGTKFSAYVARPEGAPRGAIVVLQEVFGVNTHIRSVADTFADQGWLAVAPAMFERVAAGTALGYTPEGVERGLALKDCAESLPAPGVLGDIQATVHWAADQAGAVGVVGYCWGGLLAWRCACMLDGIAAVVSYYGGGMTTMKESQGTHRAPVLAHFGSRDAAIPMDTVRAFATAHPEVEVQIHDADHGFNCDQRDSHDPAAAQAALRQTLNFFAAHVAKTRNLND